MGVGQNYTNARSLPKERRGLETSPFAVGPVG